MLNLVSSDIVRDSQVKYESNADLAERFGTQEWIVRHYRTYLSDESQFSRHDQFFWRVQADKDLTHLDVRIAILIWKHANYETGEDAYPTIKRIAWLANCEIRSAIRALRKLEQRGHLSTIQGGGNSGSQYAIRIAGYSITEVPDQTIQELLKLLPIKPPQPKDEKAKCTTVAKKQSDDIRPQVTQESPPLGGDRRVRGGVTVESGGRCPQSQGGVTQESPITILYLSLIYP